MLMSQSINQSKEHTNAYAPRVYPRRDQYGNMWWDIHNPLTGKTTCVSTEEEARLCLERGTYR